MRVTITKIAGFAVLAAAAIGAAGSAEAKPADCYTSDDGNYSCNFRGTDRAGSFIASADGYPTITLEVESAGVAWVFKDFGSGNTSLPGPYYRARDDRACWNNPDTGDRLCVW